MSAAMLSFDTLMQAPTYHEKSKRGLHYHTTKKTNIIRSPSLPPPVTEKIKMSHAWGDELKLHFDQYRTTTSNQEKASAKINLQSK